LGSVVLDCPDLHALARFCSQPLGLPITTENSGWGDIGDGNGIWRRGSRCASTWLRLAG
jgi:hypothetical protein